MIRARSGTSPDYLKIASFARGRGISQLVHFTRIDSIASIIEHDGILSRKHAECVDVKIKRNDSNQLKPSDHISCTIQFPNIWVLDAFKQRFPGTSWAYLHIAPMPALGLFDARFTPVNEKTAGVEPRDGIGGLEWIYEAKPVASVKKERGEGHCTAAPTDLQAEVLIPRKIDLDMIKEVVVETSADAKIVHATLSAAKNRAEIRVITSKVAFMKDFVKKSAIGISVADG